MLKLANIQVLRAIAAFAVVFYHTGLESSTVCAETGRVCTFGFWGGGFGVALFFMISGFIMVTISWNSFGQDGASIGFLKRRITRIVPLYWLVTTAAVVGALLLPNLLKVPVTELSYVVSSYLFWQAARVNGLVRPVANLGWTLNLEMMFYLVFAMALLFRRAWGIALAVCVFAALTGLRQAGVFAPDGPLPSLPLQFWGDPISLNFSFGMIVAMIYRAGVRLPLVASVLLAAGSVASMTYIYFNVEQVILPLAEDELVCRIVRAVPAAFLFVAGALGPQVTGKNLLSRAALLVGDASYSLYLIHPFVLRPFGKIWTKVVGAALPVWMFGAACLVLALASGLALYFAAERPLMRLFHRERPPTLTGAAKVVL